jgi:hypothetical protein
LYEIKCKASLNYGLEEIINLLRAEKDANPTPLKEIISSLYLEKLWDYYFRHQRWYGSEPQTFLDEGTDVKAWSNKRTLKEIITIIYSFQNTKKLKSYSFSAYQRQICSASENQIKFNTVYEFLTWHSIELLNWSNRFLPGIYQGTHIDTRQTQVDRLIDNIRNSSISRDDQRRQLAAAQHIVADGNLFVHERSHALVDAFVSAAQQYHPGGSAQPARHCQPRASDGCTTPSDVR